MVMFQFGSGPVCHLDPAIQIQTRSPFPVRILQKPAGSGAAAAKHQRQMKHCDGGDEPTVCWPNKKHPVLLYGCFQK